MVYQDDQTVKIDDVILPGLVKSMEIKNDAQVDEQEVEGQRLFTEGQERPGERHDRSSGVVAAKPVEPVALDGRIVRVARVTAVGPHRVVVRVEQDRRLRGVVMPVECPDVVFLPMRLDAAVGEKSPPAARPCPLPRGSATECGSGRAAARPHRCKELPCSCPYVVS